MVVAAQSCPSTAPGRRQSKPRWGRRDLGPAPRAVPGQPHQHGPVPPLAYGPLHLRTLRLVGPLAQMPQEHCGHPQRRCQPGRLRHEQPHRRAECRVGCVHALAAPTTAAGTRRASPVRPAMRGATREPNPTRRCTRCPTATGRRQRAPAVVRPSAASASVAVVRSGWLTGRSPLPAPSRLRQSRSCAPSPGQAEPGSAPSGSPPDAIVERRTSHPRVVRDEGCRGVTSGGVRRGRVRRRAGRRRRRRVGRTAPGSGRRRGGSGPAALGWTCRPRRRV
ncbi:hypothetical protein QFZ55_000164 [Streptomyces luteogriseus]|nr:hypothetical protein [Streptomyces luteogriseus]